MSDDIDQFAFYIILSRDVPVVKPGLHIVGRIGSMCLRLCPKEYITAL